MEANVKPGTRCECREGGNRCHDGGGYGEGECPNEAVRKVTLRAREVREGIQLSLCTACAAFHEARQKAGA